MRPWISRGAAALSTLGVAALLGACASAASAPTIAPTTSHQAGSGHWSGLECARGTTAFARAFSADALGERTPEKAVARYIGESSSGGIARYLKPTPTWSKARDATGVTFGAAHVSLHVVRLPTIGWVVDSGQYCQ